MASRAVCPRCRRSFDESALVCEADGEALVVEVVPASDEVTLVTEPPPPPGASARPPESDPAPALPPPPSSAAGGRRTAPPISRPGTLPPLSRGTFPPSTPRADATDPLFRTTGANSSRRRTDPNLGPSLGRPRTQPNPIVGGTPIPGSGPSLNGTHDSGPTPRVDGSSGTWLGERLGPYRLLRQLGEGGMARIYLAEHEKLGRICAIKRLHADHFADRLTVARFLAEARAVGAIHHPNLVSAYDVVEEPTEIYLVMEYLDGRDVAQVLRTEGPLDPARAADIIAQACDGLAAVHQHNIIHRDLKPENIFLTRDPDGHERVKLLDFGVARLIGDRPQELKTRSGLTVGTPTYMSPEQATASEIDARSDIYTVGVVLYEMLCGSPPFAGAGYGDVMLMHVNDQPPRLSSRRADVPPWIDAIVSRCLEKEASHRFDSAIDLAAALRAGPRSSLPTLNDPRGTQRVRAIPQVKQPPRRAGANATALVLALAAVVGLLVVMAVRRSAEPPQMVPATMLPGPTANPPATSAPLAAAVTPAADTAPAVALPVAAPAAPLRALEPDLPPHRVRVITRPARAQVFVADEQACRTPCNLLIPNRAGTVEVRVTSPGYLEEKRLLDGGEPPGRLRLLLKRAPKPRLGKTGARARKSATAAKAPKAGKSATARPAKAKAPARAAKTKAGAKRKRAVPKGTSAPAGHDRTVDPFSP